MKDILTCARLLLIAIPVHARRVAPAREDILQKFRDVGMKVVK